MPDTAPAMVCAFDWSRDTRREIDRRGNWGGMIVFTDKPRPDWALPNVLHIADPSDLIEDSRGLEPFLVAGVSFIREPRTDSERAAKQAVLDLLHACKLSPTCDMCLMDSAYRNAIMNLGAYQTSAGVSDLRDCCTGRTAIIVSAGPSLARNVELLTRPGVRDRFVIIAVQTTLRGLLSMGVVPHFVVALDYHDMSGRFFEELTAADVQGCTLVAEAKASQLVLERWPGDLRMPYDEFCARIAPGAKDATKDRIKQGSTVAHLAFFLAQHLGCDPIAFIGQDLAFTGDVYYGAWNPIHDVWKVEENRYRTRRMFELERVKRIGPRLGRVKGQDGRPVWIDDQMITYLAQFEREFARAPQMVIDATEGGAVKRHAEPMKLADVLGSFAGPEPQIPPAPRAQPADVQGLLAPIAEEVRWLKVTGDMLRQAVEAGEEMRSSEFTGMMRGAERPFRVCETMMQNAVAKRLRRTPAETDADRRKHALEDIDGLTQAADKFLALASKASKAEEPEWSGELFVLDMHGERDPQLAMRNHAIAAARLGARHCWRGGLGGMTYYDEIVQPRLVLKAMGDAQAALVWDSQSPCRLRPEWNKALRRRWMENRKLGIVFCQAPPGQAGIILSRRVLEQLAEPGPWSTIGGMLGYMPSRPMSDPIGMECCVRLTAEQMRVSDAERTRIEAWYYTHGDMSLSVLEVDDPRGVDLDEMAQNDVVILRRAAVSLAPRLREKQRDAGGIPLPWIVPVWDEKQGNAWEWYDRMLMMYGAAVLP